MISTINAKNVHGITKQMQKDAIVFASRHQTDRYGSPRFVIADMLVGISASLFEERLRFNSCGSESEARGILDNTLLCKANICSDLQKDSDIGSDVSLFSVKISSLSSISSPIESDMVFKSFTLKSRYFN